MKIAALEGCYNPFKILIPIKEMLEVDMGNQLQAISQPSMIFVRRGDDEFIPIAHPTLPR